MNATCGRRECVGRMWWLGEADGSVFYQCSEGHFTRVDSARETAREIGGIQVPVAISLTGSAQSED